MHNDSTSESALPQGWIEDFLNKADLDASFQALAAYGHFYAETMRGRLRALQMRCAEGLRHFRRARELEPRAAQTLPNLIRRFTLDVYTFECVLLEAPLETGAEAPELVVPEIPQRVFQEFPEVRHVVNLRKTVDGVLRLHRGENAEAQEVFQSLVEENSAGAKDALAMFHLGLSAAQHNLGLEESSARNMASAGRSIRLGGRTINRALAAGQLFGFYSYLEEPETAKEWRGFLDSLACPQGTKDAFLKRGSLILERSTAISSLVLI